MADNVEVDVHDIKSILTSSERDYLVRNNGDQVAISTLKGKKLGLYFSASWCPPCQRFTPNLVEVYNELLPKGDIEIIFISADEDADAFTAYFSKMPWLALPFSDSETRESLDQLFKVNGIPHLVYLDENGKLITDEGVEIISEYGSEAYPFTPERFKEIKDQEEEARKNQTLESVLVSGDLNYVIGKNGSKVCVSDLVGKHILMYFSVHWCPPCRAFTPKLIETYREIKSKHDDVEVIFISSDRDENSFIEYYETMPWLALPYGDKREQSLSRHFKVDGIPMLAALGPTGKTVTTEARGLVMTHGANAYPFTEERMADIEAEFADMAKGWPDKVKHGLHEEHELVLTRSQGYGCDGCDEEGEIWAYSCEECDFDLHPECAFKENNGTEVVENKEGWVCDGDVCYKA